MFFQETKVNLLQENICDTFSNLGGMNALICDCFYLSESLNIPNRYEYLPHCHPQSTLWSDSNMNFLEDRKKKEFCTEQVACQVGYH